MKIINITLLITIFFKTNCLSNPDYISVASNKLKSKSDTIDLINRLNQNSFSLLGTNSDSARFFSDSALKLSKSVHDDYSLAVSLINLTFCLKDMNDSMLKVNYIKKALKIFQTKNDRKGEALIRTKIGDNYRKINNYEQTLNYYFSALNIYRQFNDNKHIAIMLNDKIGELYIDKGQFSKAIDVLFQSLKISEDNDDSSGIADASSNIGGIYINQNNYDNANRYFRKALSINRKLGRKKQIAKCLVNLGVYYTRKDSLHDALDYYLEALKFYQLSGEKVQNEVYINIGRLYQLMKNYSSAKTYYFKALDHAKEEYSYEGTLFAYLYIGDLYKEIGNLSVSEDYFLRCINIAKEINSIYWLSYVYGNLALISQEQKDFKSAYNYLVFNTEYNDSLYNQEKTTEIAKIELQYEQDKKDAITQQEKKTLNILMYSFIIGSALLLVLAFYIYLNYRNKKKANVELEDKNKIISIEQEKSDNLLLNILPDTIARRLKDGEETIADYFEEASVIFIDQVDFTKKSSETKPERVVQVLNKIYTEFDHIAAKYKLEKIKTIGDCYMAASGVPVPNKNHAEAAALFALEVMQKIDGFVTEVGTELRFRAGIDCGPVVAGIIGEKKFIYDLWGDTVNTASRMEQYGVPGKIQVTERFKNRLIADNEKWIDKFEERGEIEIKGKGLMRTYFLTN